MADKVLEDVVHLLKKTCPQMHPKYEELPENIYEST